MAILPYTLTGAEFPPLPRTLPRDKEAEMTVIRLAGLTGQIRARVLPKLPPLAWLLSLSDPEPALLCGTGVETFDGGFFEGCWAGDFDERNFDQARHVFGSGGKIINGEALFVTPSHTLDALYAVQRGSGFLVANSLPFLVQFADLELPYEFSIGSRLSSLKEGVDSYEQIIFRGRDWTLYRIAYENFGIRGQDIRWIPKLPAEEADFDDYVSYRKFLLDTL